MSVQDGTLQNLVESGLQKGRFHERLFSPFAKAVKQYRLISDGDRIAVCISGGKDSMLMAKLFQELQRHRVSEFELVFLVMDPGYLPENRALIEENAAALGVPLTLFESSIFDDVADVRQSPCYLCARMRRGWLYSRAKEHGCNKIALGHHYDDVIETTLMGMLYGAQVQGMLPRLRSTNYEGMELIRPMYLIREDDIKDWRDAYGLRFLNCACRFTERVAAAEEPEKESARLATKMLIREMKKNNPHVEGNIFRSMENVALDTVRAWKTGGVSHSFLERFERETPEEPGKENAHEA